MSTFPKSELKRFEFISDTPGPNVYDTQVKSEDHKHYGFLGKSERFQKISKESKDRVEEDEKEKEVEVVVDTRKIEAANLKLIKLTKENLKLHDRVEYEKNQRERDILSLNEKLQKQELQQQTLLKEKNTLSFSLIQKEKEIAKLYHKQDALRQQYEKQEKSTIQLITKKENTHILEKKLHSLEKTKEISSQELVDLKQSIKQKDQVLLTQKESIKELKKRIAGFEEKLSQKDTQLERIKRESETCVGSFNQQKQAFIEHINNLEKDLQIFERSIFEKDEQIEKVTKDLQEQSQMKEMLANESQAELTKYQRQISDQQQAYQSLSKELERHQIEYGDQTKRLIKDHQTNLEIKIATLKKEYDEKILERNDLNKTKLKESAQKLKELKEVYANNKRDLEDSLAAVQAELQTQNELYKNESELKSQTIKELNDLSLGLNAEIDSVKQELKFRIDEKLRLKEDMEANDLEKITQIENLMNTLKEFEQMNSDLKYKLDDKNRSFEEITREKSELIQKMNDKIKSLETDKESTVADVQSALANTTQELFSCRDLVKSLEQQIGEKNETHNDFANLKATEIEALKAEIMKKDQDMKNLIVKSCDMERLKNQEIKSINDRLEMKLKEFDKLVNHAKDMESCKNSSILDLEALIGRKDSEIKRLAEEFNLSITKHQEEKSSFEQQIRESDAQIALLNSDLKDFQTTNTKLEHTVVNLRNNLNESELNLESMKNQISQTQELLISRDKEFDQERKELNHLINGLNSKIETQNIDFDQIVSAMNEQIEAQKSDFESQTNNFLQSRSGNLKEIEELKKVIEKSNLESKVLNEKYIRLNDTLSEMESFNEKDKQKANLLLHKIQTLENDLESLRMEKECVEQVVRKETLIKKELTVAVERLERELKNRNSALEKSEKEFQRIEKDLKERIEFCDNVEAENLEQVEQMEKLKKESVESHDEISKLRDQLDQQVLVLSKTVEETSHEVKMKEQEIKKLTESLKDSRETNSELQELNARIRLDSQTDFDKLENEKKVLEENFSNLQSKLLSRIQKYEEITKMNESKIAELTVELSTAQQKLENTSNALELEKEKLQIKTADFDKADSLSRNKEDELSNLKQKMQVKDVLLNNNATKINQMEVELSNQQELYRELEQKLANVIHSSQIDRGKFESEIKKYVQILSDEKLELMKSSKMLEIQTQNNNNLNEEVVGLKLSIQTSEQLVMKLKVDLDEKNEKLYEKEEQIHKLELTSKSKNEDIHKLKIELDKLEMCSNAKIKEQNSEIILKRTEYERVVKESDELKISMEENINTLETKLESRNGEVKHLESEIRELTNTLTAKEQDFSLRIETMKDEIKELNSKLTKAFKDFDQRRNEFEKTLELNTKDNEEKVAKLVDLIAVNEDEFNTFKEDQNAVTEQIKARFDLESSSLLKRLEEKNEEIQKLTEKFEFLEVEKKNVVDELMKENQELSTEIADTVSKFDMKTIEFVNLSKNMEKKLDEIRENKSRISDLEILIKELEENGREKDLKFSKEASKMQSLTLELQSENNNLMKQIKDALNERCEVVDEMENIKKLGKFEFHALQQQIIELNSQIDTNSKKYESIVEEYGRHEAEFKSKISILQNELEDKNSIINRSELHLTNEITSRQLVIKSLEQKLREYKKSHDSLQVQLDSMKAKIEENEQTNQELIQSELSKQLAKSTANFALEKQNLLEQLAGCEKLMHQVQLKNDKLTIKVEEMIKAKENEKHFYDQQLFSLEQRGKLQKSEIEKITELNAEIFGHANSRQKIKHVANLKAENVSLKEKNICLDREKEILKKKLLTVERELDALKVGKSRFRLKVEQNKENEENFIEDERSHMGGISFNA